MDKTWYLPAPSSRFRVVIAPTGSVATIKVPELARKLKDLGCDVIIAPTTSACHFLVCQAKMENIDKAKANTKLSVNTEDIGAELTSYFPDLQFVVDLDEWTSWQVRGDAVVHIELRRWAQLLLLAPLDANTLAKLACGICDNLLTSLARAWDPVQPVIFCPAMNTFMFEHPHTAKHIAAIKELGMIEVPVVSKTLVCGDTGAGAMAELPCIVDAVMKSLYKNVKINEENECSKF